MTQLIVLRLALVIVALLAVRRVWRASTVQGLLTLFVPFYVFVATAKYWKDPDHGIRWHVLVLTLGGVLSFFWQQRLLQEYQAAMEAQAGVRESAFADSDDTGADENDDTAPDTTAPHATIDFGPAARQARASAPAAAASAPVAHPRTLDAVRAREVDASPVRTSGENASPVPPPPTLRDALAAATFQRGRFERESSGFVLDLPAHFHTLAGIDARRVASSLGQPPDAHEIAWVTHEDVALGAPGSWHVRVRWLDDGWIAPTGDATDPEQLLRAAQDAQSTSRRLAGSGGGMIGYAIAPTFDGAIVDWVEERLPDNAASSVLDCHALHLAQKGVIEFSVVGAAPGSQELCDISVRLLAREAHFNSSQEYSATPPAAGARAGYSLQELVAHRR